MKLTSTLFLLAAAVPLTAQTPTPTHTATARSAGTRTAGAAGAAACVKEPELSPKIPALPAGTPCPKHLYTLTTTAPAHLDYASPMAGSTVKEVLGIEPNSFSLDYQDIKAGTGALPGPHEFYTIHYSGYLVDGTKFDSSLDRGEPITIPYGGHKVIPGWDTGFGGMHVGGKRRLFIPYQLAYGANGKPPIPPKAMLIFDVELVSASAVEPKPKTPPAPPAAPAGARPTPPAAAPAANPAPADPSKPVTVPPPVDPTKPTAAPPTTPKP